MAKVYKYKDEEFSVTADKDNDCELTVSIDGFSANVSVLEKLGKFRVNGSDGLIGTVAGTADDALNQACERVLQQRSATSKKELCGRLEILYEKLEG